MLADRKWLFVLLGLVLLAVPVTYFWAKGVASRRMTEKLETGLGMDVAMGSFAIDFSGFQIGGLELQGRQGGLTVKVQDMDIEAGVFGVALRGTRAVKGIAARGVQVDVGIDEPGFRDSLANINRALGRRGSQETKPRGKTSSRQIIVRDMRVVLRDVHGILGQLEGLSLDKRAGELNAQAERFSVGNRGKDRLDVTELKASLRHQDGLWRIAAASVGAGDLGWSNVTATEPTVPPSLVKRLRTARAALAQVSQEDDTAAKAPDAEPTAPIGRLSRLTPDAKLSAGTLKVESTTDRDRVERLEFTGVRITGEPEGWFRLAGNGEASDRGTVTWDIRVNPDELRSEGSLSFRNVALAPLAPLVPEIPWHRPDQTTLSGDLTLKAGSPARIGLRGSITLSNAAFSSPRLAPVPVTGVTLRVSGSGDWLPSAQRLELAAANIELDGVLAQVQGVLERGPEHYRVDLTGSLPATNCNRVFGAIPTDLLGAAAAFSWKGTWAGDLKMTIDSRDLEATVFELGVANRCEFISSPVKARVARFEGPFTHRVIEDEKTVFKMETGPRTPNWVPLWDISPFIVQTVVSHEDASFFKHDGFAVWAIREAIVRNLQEGRYVVGASTISMQLAKNLFLHREKTIARKVQEVLYTWWLEDSFTKDKILELYLNVIEYGPQVYGIGPAAQHYFGRPASDLSPAEAAFIASILPSPKTYYRLYQLGALSNPMKRKMKRLMEHMVRRGRLSEDALAYGIAEIETFAFHRPEDPEPVRRRLPRPLPRKSMKTGSDEYEPPFIDPWEMDTL